MKTFTQQRDSDTPDEIWCLEHAPVYTQGFNGKPEHLLNPGNIPVIPVDRGGQITYHGPGQLMFYTLLDLKRWGLSIREFVVLLEQIFIDYLATWGITATGSREAPGVYVENAKIASIGLRVKKGRAYHGVAFNVDMDLTPFSGINPCGIQNLNVTDLKQHITTPPSLQTVGEALTHTLTQHLSKRTGA